MPFRRRRHPIVGLVEDRPLVVAIVVILGTGILAVVAWWWADGSRNRADDDPVLAEMFASGKTLEGEFLSVAATRDPTAEDLALLGRAIENQRNWMRATRDHDPEQAGRLRQMEATYEGARAKLLAATSREAEVAARADLAAGRGAEALSKLEEALAAQRELNRGHPRAEHRNLPRESQLAQEAEALRAAPLAEALAASVAVAREAAEAGRRDDALAAWRAARETQARINREFPRVRHADLGGLDRIDAELDTLASDPDAARIAGLQLQATEAAARGRTADAATLFGEAIALQRAINSDSPRSRHVSTERLELLEIERQTALGAALVSRIAAIDRELSDALVTGDTTTALRKIAEGGAAMDELASRYPRSRQADPGLRLRFDYLTTVRGTLAATFEKVRDGMEPIPGDRGATMLRTEVPQQLYEHVMGSNPSRIQGGQIPVDSVTWHDAAEFCRRLSWITGRVVRLPTEDEFRAAVGSTSAAGHEQLVWRPPASDPRPRRVTDGAVNANGFSDLLGNVAEWLDTSGAAGGDLAPVAGGSFNDPPDADVSPPIALRARDDRSRSTGFRFVIEGR